MDRHELKESLIKINPKLKGFLDAHTEKRELALELRAVRKKVGLTAEDIAERSGMTIEDIERIEAPSGALPAEIKITKYRCACIEHQ